MSFRTRLKESFVSGLILVLPFVVVLFVLDLMMSWVFKVVNPVVRRTSLTAYTSNIEIVAQVIAGVLVFLIMVLLGYLYSSERSAGWKKGFGKLIDYVPLFGTIYLSVRQVAASIGERENKFKKLVAVEYPRNDIYSLGLVTSEAPSSLENLSDENLYSVYFPNSPNPTGGRTVVIPESEIIEVDMSVQRGMKLMLTTGMAFEDEDLPEELSGKIDK